ncbi:glycosyltransferase family protein [Bacteroides pyogenes]|uniref:glycosyltransferase family 4 protein n=1 Tax=Bacteroides pyogenes TaxID=310300 RepID=UPI0003DD937F|nr:glycosyltransferase family 4 protein [Bacteroides pyogenes]MBB3894809.1 hypothetical protein [Bacteroides pyogenes]GAE21178.1 hypothetical protein JCM10003_589 [Bacteroides pyogenes JCM 10003]SUV35265.1 Uncharacterised protein [Bacteroides pyogenes]
MKILIISHNPFSSTSNNGKTLETIFQEYNSEDISMFYFSEMLPDLDYNQNYFRITDKDVIKNTLSFTTKYYKSFFSKDEKVSTIMSFSLEKKKRIVGYVKKIPFLRDFLWKCGKWKIKPLFNWIESNDPDCIFYVAGPNSFSHSVANFLSKKYNLPLILFFTDDYLLNPKCRNWIDVWQRKRMAIFYQHSINRASLCFAIGELMASDYQVYFKKPFFPIMNIAELSHKLPTANNEGIVISYFGGLHLGRWAEIAKLGKLLTLIQKDGDVPNIQLKVYSATLSSEVERCFKECNVNYAGFVNSDKMRMELAKADILLHVESTDDYYRSLTKLSVSTKLPEYISTGRSILGFGPFEVASMRLLSDHRIGYVISSDWQEDKIKTHLKSFIKDVSLREELANNAYEYAWTAFNPDFVRKQFMKKVDEIIKKRRIDYDTI